MSGKLASFSIVLLIIVLIQVSNHGGVYGKGEVGSNVGQIKGSDNPADEIEVEDYEKEPNWELYNDEEDGEEWDDIHNEDGEYYDEDEDEEYYDDDDEEDGDFDDSEEFEIGADGEQIPNFPGKKQKKSRRVDGDTNCDDGHEHCSLWANMGECVENPTYMLENCRKSCQTCSLTKSQIVEEIQIKIEEREEKERLAKQVKKNFGVKQAVHSEKTTELIRNYTKYMKEIVMVEDRYEEIRGECQNRETLCSEWAIMGECEANPSYMLMHCAVACQTCHKLIFRERCPWNSTTHPDVFKPGEMNPMFERIENSPEFGDHIKIYSRDPWVITIDNFIKPEEADRLIELGRKKGYERSLDVGGKEFDGSYKELKSDARTSTNAWCDEECFDDPVVKEVRDRIHRATSVPQNNSEHLQLLHYEVGQYYKTHHDYIEHEVDRAEGPRILTVFLYLNDVEGGGGTDFPDLGITVMPKRGTVLIWPSVLDSAPDQPDRRTDHQALPVEKGEKFAANAWLHLRDFAEPQSRGCT